MQELNLKLKQFQEFKKIQQIISWTESKKQGNKVAITKRRNRKSTQKKQMNIKTIYLILWIQIRNMGVLKELKKLRDRLITTMINSKLK